MSRIKGQSVAGYSHGILTDYAKSTLSFALSALVLLAVCLPACSSEKRTRVYPVKGVVVVQGKQADNSQVMLHPVDPKIMEGLEIKPMGLAGPDGKFAITSYVTGDGAPAGDYVVTVEWRDKAEGAFDSGTPDKLGGRYADPATSPLKIKVEKKTNDLPPFELQ